MVWANPRSLTTTCGITIVFFSYGYLDVSVPHVCLPVNRNIQVCTWMGCPIRTSPDQRLFAPPRSFSQLVTSFFASESQGIHHSLLLIFIVTFVLDYHLHNMIASCGDTLLVHLYKKQSVALIVFSLCISSQYVKDRYSVVENNGFEPLTPCVQGRCSSQLS